MGNSTVIELNHDWVIEIEHDPEKFVREILDHLNQMPKIDEGIGKRIAGGTIVSSFHRSNNEYDRLWTQYRIALRDYGQHIVDKAIEMKAKGFHF